MKTRFLMILPFLVVLFALPAFLWTDSSFAGGGTKAREDDLDTLIRRVEEVERQLRPTREAVSVVEREVLECTSNELLCTQDSDCCSGYCAENGECADGPPVCTEQNQACDSSAPTDPCCIGLGCSPTYNLCFPTCAEVGDCPFGYFCIDNICELVP